MRVAVIGIETGGCGWESKVGHWGWGRRGGRSYLGDAPWLYLKGAKTDAGAKLQRNLHEGRVVVGAVSILLPTTSGVCVCGDSAELPPPPCLDQLRAVGQLAPYCSNGKSGHAQGPLDTLTPRRAF